MQEFVVDKSAVTIVKGAVETHGIAGGKGFFKAETLHIGGQGFLWLGGDGEEAHTEGAQAFGHGLSDIAETHDGHFQTVQFDDRMLPVAEILAACPFAFVADALRVAAHLVANFQQVRHDRLSHSLGAVARTVAHGDAVATRRLHIYDIVARSRHADKFELRTRGKGFLT